MAARETPTSSSIVTLSGSTPNGSRYSPAWVAYALVSAGCQSVSGGGGGGVVATRARTSMASCSCGLEIPNSITVVP